jgi:hypothetical protein
VLHYVGVVLFDVRYHNGCLDIEARTREEAEEKVGPIVCETLVEQTNDLAAEVEAIELLKPPGDD